LQYWIPDYLQNVIKVDAHTTSVYFSTTSLSAPIGGVFVGGVMTSSYGGYNSKKGQIL